VATAIGLLLCAATQFTWLWLAMGFCLGVCAETLAAWEQGGGDGAADAAAVRWRDAYYCGTHARVFFAGETRAYSLEQLAESLPAKRAAAAPAPVAARAEPPPPTATTVPPAPAQDPTVDAPPGAGTRRAA
jgi:hypothetical protein